MRIHYVSGSRADFGLMARTLVGLSAHPGINIAVVITGQHLSVWHGNTKLDIVASGLPIAGEIPVTLTGADGAEMAHAMATELKGFVEIWERDRPDLVLVLGDRGEMLAATIAAVHLGIHVAHLHGGELSGTLDESFRHAISKLAHFHLAATQDAAERLVQMGERRDRIWVVGAPGLVGLTDNTRRTPGWMTERFDLPPQARNNVLVALHPVVQEAGVAALQVRTVLDVLKAEGCSGVVMRPNSDAGGAAIDAELDAAAREKWFRIVDHLDRESYLEVLREADAIVGNSSSGIIESASFGTPCLNIGSRQNGRLRNANVVDCPEFDPSALMQALRRTLRLSGSFENLYGDGKTTERLCGLLPSLPLLDAILAKANTY